MRRLKLLEQVFYKLEKAGFPPLYMGGAAIIDPEQSSYSISADDVLHHLAAIMDDIPLMRKKLVRDGLMIGDLKLVDDPDFDVYNHITITKLKRPGGYKQLTDCLSALAGEKLDLAKPLWRYHVIEGLENGRIAIFMRLHHSIADGVGAQQALSSLWSAKPVKLNRLEEVERVIEEPGEIDLLGTALREEAKKIYIKAPAMILKRVPGLFRSALVSIESGDPLDDELQENKKEQKPKVPRVYRTSLNAQADSAGHVLEYVSFQLAEVKALCKEHSCTVNDMALAINSFVLQYYFETIGETIDFDLVAIMPVSKRKKGDENGSIELGISRINLRNQVVSIIDRLKAISRDTVLIRGESASQSPAKKHKAVDMKEITSLLSPITVDGLVYGLVKLKVVDRALFGNVAITNVPGSPVPLYFAGAPVVEMVPMAPVVSPVGLTVSITSTADKLTFGYHGCAEVIKDKRLFVEGAEKAFEALCGKDLSSKDG